MKRIAQLIVTIVVFLASAFILNIIAALLIGNNANGLAFLGNFPGQTQSTYLDRYFGFMAQDTLGWFTYLTLSSTQNMQILAGGVMIYGGYLMYIPTLSPLPSNMGAIGLIPIMIDYHPWSTLPLYFNLALAWVMMLVLPFIITGIIAGAVAKTKKDAMQNMFFAILIIAIAGIVMNFIHVYMNFPLSADWKFSATIIQNPIYAYLLALYGNNQFATNQIVYVACMSIGRSCSRSSMA